MTFEIKFYYKKDFVYNEAQDCYILQLTVAITRTVRLNRRLILRFPI